MEKAEEKEEEDEEEKKTKRKREKRLNRRTTKESCTISEMPRSWLGRLLFENADIITSRWTRVNVNSTFFSP